MKNLVQSYFVSVCMLRPIRQAKMTTPLLQETFIEMSEVHWENLFYPYICTDSISLVNVSPWEER